MQKPEYHILVCNSFRLNGQPQGVCNKKEAVALLQYLEDEIVDRGLDVMVSSTGCMKLCEQGPIMVIYPAGWWYRQVTEEKIDEILDALEEGTSVENFLLC